MVGEINHPCFTFLRFISSAINGPDGVLTLIEYQDIRAGKYKDQEIIIIVTNPYFQQGDDILNNLKFLEPLDLCLSKKELFDYKLITNTTSGNQIKFLDTLFLNKLQELKPDQVFKFLEGQFDLFVRNNDDGDFFIQYLLGLIDSNPSPINFKIQQWCDTKNKNVEKNNKPEKTKQGTAFQIALVCFYLILSKRLTFPLAQNKRNIAKLMQFLTGIDYDRIEKKMVLMKRGNTIKIPGGSSGQMEATRHDLLTVKKLFEDCSLIKEAILVQLHIEEIDKEANNRQGVTLQ